MAGQPAGPALARKTFVLCFDGTGNKFSGDESDSNVLKIYRMLDRADGSTFTFYQPGIGTYVSSSHVSQTKSSLAKIKSWYVKSKDAAVGSSFAEHVMGGYRFLMRYYSAEDDLYFFGFSRGAYTARFLAEMLDHVGLLSAGNEELASFAWKTYAKWAGRAGGTSKKEKEKELEIYNFMRGFRETFSRRVRRIRFLGLFDTVNSVPAFEGAWMQRSKFPYTARSSAKTIRHAVAIDERRAKFRQDLMTGSKREPKNTTMHRYNTDLGLIAKAQKWKPEHRQPGQTSSTEDMNTLAHGSAVPSINITEADEMTERPEPNPGKSVDFFADAPEHPSNLQIGPLRQDHMSVSGPMMTLSVEDLHAAMNQVQPEPQASGQGHKARRWSDMTKSQDIEEVWFPGCHGDIGGGWAKRPNERRMLSHVPLAWMVTEAEKAGLKFDPIKMATLNCCPDAIDDNGDRHGHPDALDLFHDEFHSAATAGKIHDALVFGDGLAAGGVAAWKVMEYLPFRRMDLQSDGSWSAIRWPLPCGETRDIPSDAQIHISAINRMKHDPKYRPGNLIVGGGGRGTRTAPEQYGTGEWKVFKNEGDRILETYVRANDPHTEEKY